MTKGKKTAEIIDLLRESGFDIIDTWVSSKLEKDIEYDINFKLRFTPEMVEKIKAEEDEDSYWDNYLGGDYFDKIDDIIYDDYDMVRYSEMDEGWPSWDEIEKPFLIGFFQLERDSDSLKESTNAASIQSMSFKDAAQAVIDKRDDAINANKESIQLEKQLFEKIAEVWEKGTGDDIVNALEEIMEVYTSEGVNSQGRYVDKSNYNIVHKTFTLKIEGPEWLNDHRHRAETIRIRVNCISTYKTTYAYVPEFGIEDRPTVEIFLGYNNDIVLTAGKAGDQNVSSREIDIAEKLFNFMKKDKRNASFEER